MSDVAAAIRAKLEHEYENEACYGGCGTEYCRCTVSGFDEMKAALLAVLELHAAFAIEGGEFQGLEICTSCGDTTDEILSVNWPCPTVLAVAKALGVNDA